MRRLLAPLLLCAAAALPARAASLDDFLLRGYAVVAATALPGSFTGCVREHRLVFADGSVFACARTAAQTAFDARVYILRSGAGPPSVVLVGSRVQRGELLRLKLHDYPVPLRMNGDPLSDAPASLSGALAPGRAIPSINATTDQLHAALSSQQSQLPSRSPNFRSSR